MNRLPRLLKSLLRSRQHNELCARAEQEIMAQRFFSYVRVGFDQRDMELAGGHGIARGADAHEQTWRVQYRRGSLRLLYLGEKGITCSLSPVGDGQWRGKWRFYERMDILLKPASAAAPPPALGASSLFQAGEAKSYYIVQRYRRTVALRPGDKKLVTVASVADAPLPFGRAVGRLSDEVLFFKLQEPAAGRQYWSKKYAPVQRKQLHLELGLYEELAKIDTRAVLPVDYQDEFGLIFDFDPELFHGPVVHLEHAHKHFSPVDANEIAAFAATSVQHPVLGRQTIGDLADFQTVLTSRGLVHIDFMIRPRHWWNL